MKHMCNCFQFKILNDILFTNSRLAKIGLIQSDLDDLCTFCNIGGETIDHFSFTVFTLVSFGKYLKLIGSL